jgi:hypothetical protein
MATRYTDKFRRDALRIATTSGLTLARQSVHSIDEYPYWSSWILMVCKGRLLPGNS